MDNTHNTGGPAFPTSNWQKMVPQATGYHEGMTLRDWFAAKAMQGAISGIASRADEPLYYSDCAGLAYEMADAMLKARDA
jgi:hypothetical protein